MSRPNYYVRPNDFEIFSLNADGKTYSSLDAKTLWPDKVHNKFTEKILIDNGFFAGEEEEDFEDCSWPPSLEI